MTATFATNRLIFYRVVLGIGAHFASVFLPNLHRISLTILGFLISIQWAQPRTEAISYLILGSCCDIIGNIQCDALKGQRTATKSGDMDAQSYCYESKVVQAFSWLLFVLFALAMITLVQLASQAKKFGYHDIWNQPIQELGWFDELPGYYNQHGAMQPADPGRTIYVNPQPNGAPPIVHTVPYGQPNPGA
ncbi:hypothetical protein DL96DRAFT_1594796 [Flagelloscypha sp. PMI_526]|nr:hypothetical protein DL96DRAFT_1594796 [Flagelloscypha sp. PMI_526]